MSDDVIALASDHAGITLKTALADELKRQGHAVLDLGTESGASVDYPDFGYRMAAALADRRATRGVLVCGTGIGISIAANRYAWVRAALCHDVYLAHQCVEHDDVNVLCLGAQIVGNKLVEEILLAFVNATFSTEEHFRRRVAKLADMEKRAASEFSG